MSEGSKICPKCRQLHQKSGVYCSRKCANSRIFTAEARRKKSEAAKHVWLKMPEDEKKRKLEILKNTTWLTVMERDWVDLGIQSKRLRVILEQDGKCNRCGLFEWQGEPINLELEHKDGNNSNNSRDNLEVLCPNCHSMTKTWRGRKNGRSKQILQNNFQKLSCSSVGRAPAL